MERLSYLTIASLDTNTADSLARQMACRYIKTTVSDDILWYRIFRRLEKTYLP